MDTNLDVYKVFYYVCEFKNLTKVADILYVTQPAITKQIKKLEETLGKSLIIRTSKGIKLTNEGELLYREIKTPIESIIRANNTFKNKVDNYETSIKIIAGHSTIKNLLLPAMVNFNKEHPNVKFEMSTYPYQKAIQKLRRNEADLIFYTTNEITENYNDIVTKEICPIHDILVVSGNVKKRYPNKISILDLDNFKTIAKQENSSCRAFIDNYFKEHGKNFIPTYQLSNYWLVHEYVALGLGIGLGIKEFEKNDLASGSVVQIETEETIPERQMAYSIQKNSALYGIIKDFMKHVTF